MRDNGYLPPEHQPPTVSAAVAFALVWLFLLGWLIGFGVVFVTGADWMVAVAIWFGGTIVAGIVGAAIGK